MLGITEIDPLEHGLYFERFLHAGRPEPPDIDVDVDSNRRDELIEWVRQRFGRERVAIGSHASDISAPLGARDGLRALGTSPSAITRVTSQLPLDDIAGAATDRERSRVLDEPVDGAVFEVTSVADEMLASWRISSISS